MLSASRRLTCVLLTGALILGNLLLPGCDSFRPRKVSSSTPLPPPHSRQPEETTKSSAEPDATPTPDPDPDHAAMTEALEKAAEHNIPEESLRGRYDLFLRFCRCIESNGRLGEFVDYVYLLFPMIADQIKPENEEYFLAKISSLRIAGQIIATNHAGEYHQSDNTAFINSVYLDSDDISYLSTVMHELTHFVDTNIDGPIEKAVFTPDNVYPLDDVPSDATGSIIASTKADFFVEGCAELYEAKYFSHFIDAYTPCVEFITALEYLCGSDWLDDIFFSHDSPYKFYSFMLSQGFTTEELIYFDTTMYAMSYWKTPTGTTLRPEDVLIRLYENIRGGDFKEDPTFCYILSRIYKKDFDFDVFPSPNEEFLRSNLLTEEEADEFYKHVIWQLDASELEEYSFYHSTVCCLYLDDKLYLVFEIRKTTDDSSTDSEKPVHKALIFDYDFEKGVSSSFEIFTPPLSEKNG